LDVECQFARAWRQTLSGLDLDAVHRHGRLIIDRLGRPSDLAKAKAMAMTLLDKPGSRYTREILESFHVPGKVRHSIVARWNERGRPPIKAYAPYTAHVATVDTFFCIALGAELIGRKRPSNRIDIAYLYYLPSCMGFTSNDALHARTAPLFMADDQMFIDGRDLKADLAKLDAHYWGAAGKREGSGCAVVCALSAHGGRFPHFRALGQTHGSGMALPLGTRLFS